MAMVGVCEKSAGSVNVAGIELTKKNLPTLRAHAGVVLQNPDDQLSAPPCSTTWPSARATWGWTKRPSSGGSRRCFLTWAPKSCGTGCLIAFQAAKNASRRSRRCFRCGLWPCCSTNRRLLDPRARRHVAGLLSRLPHTMLIATHDLDMALDVCERVIVLRRAD